MDYFKTLEDLYLSAPINKYHNPTIKVDEGNCTITQLVDNSQFHKAKALHGSIIFKLLDDAAFFASNSVVEDKFVLTGTFKVKFLKPVTKGTLTAKGKINNRSGKKVMASSEVFDEEEECIAIGEGIFIISDIDISSL